METVTPKQKRPLRWAYCPVCQRERRYTPAGKFVDHRRFVPALIVDPKQPYGFMEPCDGRGMDVSTSPLVTF